MQQIVLKINFFFNDASQNSNELSGHFYLKKKVKKVKINKVDYELDRSGYIATSFFLGYLKRETPAALPFHSNFIRKCYPRKNP